MVKILGSILLLFFSVTFGQTKKIETKTKSIVVDEIKQTQPTIIISNSDTLTEDISAPQYDLEDTTIYSSEKVEVQPEFPGGYTKLFTFFKNQFKVSQELVDNQISGEIFLSFTVEKDGSLTNIKVLKDLGFNSGKEAKRVMNLSPRWSPAESNGKKVRCYISIPFTIYARE